MIGAMQGHMQQREKKDKEDIVVTKHKRAPPELRVGSDDPHDMRRVRVKTKGKDTWRCARCKVKTTAIKKHAALQLQQCPDSVRARLQPHASHRIVDTGAYVYCRVCGIYGLDKSHSLRARCKGHFADSATKTGGQLSRLRRGLHPHSGRKLL